jgi:ribosomal protein S18 acetylase RimI-like enzyme
MLDRGSLNNEISVGVTFASLMAAISLFFTGVLVSAYDSLGETIKVPMLFLIVSTFSFIFAATIYSNAGSEITLGKIKHVEKYMVYATNIVEFLGLYPLIISMPLVIGAVTQDTFLRIATTVVAIGGMALYSQSRFSILEKQLPGYQKRFYSLAIVCLALLLYVAQYLQQSQGQGYYAAFAIVLLAMLMAPAIYFSTRSNQYRVVRVRPFREDDTPALVRIAKKNLERPSAKARQSAHMMLSGDATLASIRNRAESEQVLVAVTGGARLGFISLHHNTITVIATDPSIQRKGIGRMLVESAESVTAEAGYEEINAKVTAPHDRFYRKLGFIVIDTDDRGAITMNKEL